MNFAKSWGICGAVKIRLQKFPRSLFTIFERIEQSFTPLLEGVVNPRLRNSNSVRQSLDDGTSQDEHARNCYGVLQTTQATQQGTRPRHLIQTYMVHDLAQDLADSVGLGVTRVRDMIFRYLSIRSDFRIRT